jgi:predicted metalloprotease with PDZ domain
VRHVSFASRRGFKGVSRLVGHLVPAVAVLAASAAWAVPAHGAPLARVLITPSAMSESNGGVVEVLEVFPHFAAATGAPLLSISNVSPGLTAVQRMEDLVVTDDQGSVSLAPDKPEFPEAWKTTRQVAGTLTIHYRLPIVNDTHATGGPQGSPRIDGDGISSTGEMLLMKPETSQPYRLSVKWNLAAMGPGAGGVWTYGEGNVSLPAGPVLRLQNSFFMAGHIKREPEKLRGAFSAVWTGDPGFDPRPSLRWARQLHGWMSHFFADPREATYRIFLRYNPAANAGGGSAFPNSFLWTYGQGVAADHMKGILGHEMTHTWTATDMGKWFDEGLAVYYQQRLPWMAHMISSDAYLADINKTAARFYTNELSHLADADVIRDYWSDVRLIVIPYDRGAMYFAILDSKIRKTSNGKRSVDDLVRYIVERNRNGLPTDEAYWVDMLQHELGEDGVSLHKAMMSGDSLVPDSDAYSPCFRRIAAQIRRYELGYNQKRAAVDGVVEGLIAGSEADKAGIREGDKIVLRTNTDGAQRDPQMKLNVKISRAGNTVPITYLPRGAAVAGYQWERAADAAATSCAPSEPFGKTHRQY